MTKILVKKSAPKGILVKQIQPQLMQMPKGGKSLKDFVRVLRTPTRTQDTPGVSRGAKFAAGLGVLGKIGAGLSTVNQTMQSMQGGNLSAPLSAGYTFEAADPTGRMISQAADPSLSYAPAKQKLSNAPPKKVSVDAFLDPRNSHTRGPTGPPIRLPPTKSHPEGELISQNDPRVTHTITGKPVKTDYSNTPYAQMLAAGKGMSQQQAKHILTHGQNPFEPFVPFRPSPVQVPNTAVPGAVESNVTDESGPMYSTETPPGGVMNEFNNPSPPMQALQQQQQQQQTKTLADHLALMGQPAAPQPVAPAPQPVAPVQQPQQAGVSPTFYQQNQNQLMRSESFVTALTEKLGADIVYKMTPHQIGTFAAYTLLKLR